MHFCPIFEPFAPVGDGISHTTTTSEANSAHAGDYSDRQGGGKGGMGDNSSSQETPGVGCCPGASHHCLEVGMGLQHTKYCFNASGIIASYQPQSSSGNISGVDPAQPEINKVVNAAASADDDGDADADADADTDAPATHAFFPAGRHAATYELECIRSRQKNIRSATRLIISRPSKFNIDKKTVRALRERDN
eukprot:3446531-Pleurochrysis_carterae.AAC.1